MSNDSNNWLRYLEFWRRDPKRDLDDEIGFHLDMRVRDLVAGGMSPHDARAKAQREFGDERVVREQTMRIDRRILRRESRFEWLGGVAADARVALRSLRRTPTFTITAVLCAALGIGVTATIVSVYYAVLVRPLPYADADRLVTIYSENVARGYHETNISYGDYKSWRSGTRAFSGIGIWTWTAPTLSVEGGDAERVEGASVAANLFTILGVHPAMGRTFLDDEETPGRDNVTILSDRLWRQRFSADRAIIGRQITIDGKKHTVVGVMPPNFNFPEKGDVWVPFSPPKGGETEHDNRMYAAAIGRLAPNTTFEQGVADLRRVDAEMIREFPNNEGWRAEPMRLRDDLVGDLRQPLRIFLGAVTLVLLIVCANLANLLLARGATRAREVAVRSALGASRGRLTRQLLTESLVIAALGGIVGVFIAAGGVRLIRFAYPDQTPPFFVTLGLDPMTLVIVLAVTIATGLLFGVVPSIRAVRSNLSEALRDGDRAVGGGVHRSRMRSLLAVGEIALSVVLTVAAALLVRSYVQLQHTDLGFRTQGVLTGRVYLPRPAYPTLAAEVAFFEQLEDRLRHLPGVVTVGSAQGIPFSGWNVQGEVSVQNAPPVRRGDELIAHMQTVTPDFFPAIGVSLVRGRWLTAADRDTMAPVVLINEQMAAKGFAGRDPIGQHVRFDKSDPWATVVGIVHDYRHYRLPQPMGPAVYYPNATIPMRQLTTAIYTHGDPHELIPALRAAVRELDPRLAVFQVQTIDEAVSRSFWRQRLQSNVLGVFAVLSLVLACIGLYGVIAYGVAQRTRELGVRIALGASRGRVLALIVGESGRLVVAGVIAGILASVFASRMLGSLLYGVTARDPLTFASVPLVLAVVALVAAVIPARRASRVDPIEALRG